MIKEIYILDTRAISTGLTIPGVDMYTTNLVIREVRGGRRWGDIQEAKLKTSNIRVLDPTPKWLHEAKKLTEQTGDRSAISKTDLSVIALALQLVSEGENEIIVLSDDYSLMNVCRTVGIRVKPILFQGIAETKTWEWYCPACGHKPIAGSEDKPCPVCGTRLKRRAVTKSSM